MKISKIELYQKYIETKKKPLKFILQQIYITIKNKNFPCDSDFIIIGFPSGDNFRMENVAKNCPEGYVLFSSELNDEEKIAKIISDGSQLPISINNNKTIMSLLGEPKIEDMKTFIKELKYDSQ